MKKNYRVDGSLGQITKKLEDRIQDQSGLTLRERSFETLINFIPTEDYLTQTINGVKLEYLIKNEPCKSFFRILKGHQVLIHIFSDKIITYLPKTNKYFIDGNLLTVAVSSVSTCFVVEDTLIFNSITGVYFARNSKSLETTENGKPIYQISIPSSLTGDKIDSVTGDVYFVHYTRGAINPIPVQTEYSAFDKYLSAGLPLFALFLSLLKGFYIHLNTGLLNIGDLVDISNISVGPEGQKVNVTGQIIAKVKGFKFLKQGVWQIYPAPDLPDPYPDGVVVQGSTTSTVSNIPNNAVQIDLYQIDFTYNHTQAFDDSLSLYKYDKYATRWLGYRYVLANITYADYYRETFCFQTLNPNIKVTYQTIPVNETKVYSPYTPYSLGNRLAVSTRNIIKLSKVGEYSNFDFTPQTTPTETDAFQRTLKDVDEITFISRWGQLGVQEGFVIGTPKELIYFSSIANIFSTTIISRRNIPCSYIPPLDIKLRGFPTSLIVASGRTKIFAVIFTRDQTEEIELTETTDFFEANPIIKIQSIQYEKDQMVFALTEYNKLYVCVTGNIRPAWFEIRLNYKIEDIATADEGLNKKLYIISSLENRSGYNLVGSMDFTEGIQQIKAEYYSIDINLQDDNIFISEVPYLSFTGEIFKTKDKLSTTAKTQLAKPITSLSILHNQEIINNNYNTKASRTKRKITNVNIQVKDSNNFKIKYICQDNNLQPITKVAYDIQRNDDDLNPKRVKELIKVFTSSPANDSVKLAIETSSIVPLTIQSISFDTEYVNIK